MSASIVRDYKIGNTRIKIFDDYCKDKTPEDIEEILRRITQNALNNFNAALTDYNQEILKNKEVL